jgi:hypothetical protein
MISAYFSKRMAELKMPVGPDSLGIRWEGAVMEGRMSVGQRLALDRREVVGSQLNRDLQAGPAPVYVREFPPLVGGRVPGQGE